MHRWPWPAGRCCLIRMKEGHYARRTSIVPSVVLSDGMKMRVGRPFANRVGNSISPYSCPPAVGSLAVGISPTATRDSEVRPVWAITCRHVAIPRSLDQGRFFHPNNKEEENENNCSFSGSCPGGDCDAREKTHDTRICTSTSSRPFLSRIALHARRTLATVAHGMSPCSTPIQTVTGLLACDISVGPRRARSIDDQDTS